MPSAHELLILLAAIFGIWILLKLARLAIKMIVFVITIVIIVGVFWLFFPR
ncbi:MAG TPA: hypothetical protein VNA69_24130 [Thermoanaerobaculia bacterium]|nr:hypothetical protein [Thermoanaerobaculia bacterium]